MINKQQILALPDNHAMNVWLNEIFGAWGTTRNPPKFTSDFDALKEQRIYFPDAFQPGFSPLRVCQEILILQLDKLNEENWLDEEEIELIKKDDWINLAKKMKVWRDKHS